MNNKIKYLASAMMVAAFGATFTACDDWTEPEHIDINYGSVDKAENYPAYLESIRKYRESDHKQVYAWVNLNENGPKNQSERLTALPDSIDVIVLSTPTKIHPTVLADMNTVREQKGMKVIYQIDFDALKAKYTTLCENVAKERSDLELEYAALIDAAETEEEKAALAEELDTKLEAIVAPVIEDFILANLTESLSYAKDNNLDGAMFAFDGKASNHLTAAELAEYKAQQLVFLGAARDWHKRNPELAYDFLGTPQNVSDKELLNEFGMLFLRQGLSATNVNLYTYYLTLAQTEGVPVERLGMMTTYTSNDPDDAATGMFSDGTLALDNFAKWLQSHDVACVGIQNVQNDYFNPQNPFSHVRAVIQAANPNIQ